MSDTHIIVNFYALDEANEKRRPAEIIRDFGIKYERMEPQEIADQCKFVRCTEIPDDLPSYVWLFRDGRRIYSSTKNDISGS